MRALGLLLCVALAASAADALYSKDGPVPLLNPKTFEETVVDSDLVHVVEFFAPWCGHCKALAPQYQKVAETLQGIVGVSAVDCDDAGNRKLCSEHGVQGFPTIKIFPVERKKNPYTGKLGKMAVDYNGARNAKAIADAATAQIPSAYITKVKSGADFEAFKGRGDLPKIVLVSSKGRTTALYKSLSCRFKGRLAFAEARDSVKEVVEELGAEELPALVVLMKDGQQAKYEGKLKAPDLIAFLGEHAAPATSAAKEAAPDAESADKPTPQVVRALALEEVEEIIQLEDPWLLGFFKASPQDDCAVQAEALNKLAYDMGFLVNVGQVNVTDTDPTAVAAYGLDLARLRACEMELLLLPFGDKSEADEWLPYTGEKTAKAVSKFVTESLPSPVTRITADSLQPFMSLDLARPKVILFTTKEATPAVFNALAVNFRNYSFVFGDVHGSDAAVVEQFNVKKVPSMLVALFPPSEGQDPSDPKGLTKLQLQPYPGPLKYPYMHAYLEAIADMIGAKPQDAGSFDTTASALGAKPGALAPVPEVADNAALEKECLGKLGLCVVALLDGSSEGLQDQLGAIKAAAAKHAQQPLHFLWVDAPRQHTFAAQFGIASADLPALVAFSPRKLRYARLQSEVTPAGISELVHGLLAGRQTTTPLQDAPKLVDGGEEPTEEPAPEEIVEEEFDLADILNEEVEAAGGTKEDLLKQVDQQLKEEEERRKQKEAEEAAAAKRKGKKKVKGGKLKKGKKIKEEL
ncbi:hypothetical protein WJX72_010973 [[Myrmecia] bisecta]|uniref:protein disulfide-isomerase n=1 Tax=[Myrmecia] bisecta TaxID=41462 RepID=A0AAW1QA27_9CHLO